MKSLRKWLPAVLLGSSLVLAACGGDSESDSGDEGGEESSGDKEVSIGMNNWAENIAVSNMWKIVLEEEGYDVELEQVEKGVLYEALAAGDLDIGMEIWLPNTDASFYEQYEEDIDWRETWYEGTELGLVVPSYMEDVNSIEDLNDNVDELDGQIVGIDSGASIMSLTDDAIEEYDLDYSLAASSEGSMMTELTNAIENEEPIVVTHWTPHWAFSEMDLKFLEDPENVYGDSEDISYAARLDLEEDNPELVEWFDNFMLDDQQLGELMASINEADSEEEGAQAWIDENQDVIDEWME
ncbi:glycine/betaine ABC transporter [Halobacillus andaensis]|uniref:Glycine/betaine ABC transporter n=1 Tax=Halobacillus andaensis TaxID=1176239 RepID=A0A917BA48_HALAA|nr:glycine betaine ABC transporter substrate-binding protein [Halobacillus andaensis]MBP2005538.1 glycine betaine/proline transport system substrate-binding protein [Halobacillus andaensis]GGF32257.1 glycine/betaine ABC transporter [Halobacillus andaensis]